MSPRAGLDLPQIVGTAAQLADKDGVEAVTLASVAQKLGVKSPSLYNHVNGLPALRSHLVIHGLARLNEVIREAAGESQGDQAVMNIAAAYLSFARGHPGLYSLTLRSPSLEQEEHVKLGAELVERLLSALSPYSLSQEEGIHAVRGLRSLLHGFASIEAEGGFGMPVSLNESFRFALGRFLAGLERLSS
ncbi:TetR/AcrR family transcriptional regulator [Paenibacillus paeoniae]|uniref:TetR family transcriptional regulator n=1 Tax=Paenibacillus paeoniae TaxID=2292705 RepID=A0A371PFI3_9BACL|nr:TetR/AcrR family transcriptional regulator [Paenibacillus paeoniae]REK74635.1 TetR family transcriptional regulator [Paenibacillus paeoniae]